MNTGIGWHAGWHAGWHLGTVRTHQAFFSGSRRREILHCCSSYWETESISMQMQESQDQQTIEDHSRSHFASPLLDVGWIQCMLKLEPCLIIFESSLVILESSRCLVRECESFYPNLSESIHSRSMFRISTMFNDSLHWHWGLLNVHRRVWRSPRRWWAKHVGISRNSLCFPTWCLMISCFSPCFIIFLLCFCFKINVLLFIFFGQERW